MIEERIGYRYAKSVFDLSLEKGTVEQVKADMEMISETCKISSELQYVLGSPIISSDKKQSVLKAIFGAKYQAPLSATLVDSVVENGRESYLAYIADSFVKLYDQKYNIDKGQLVTAELLDEATVNEIVRAVEAKTGRKFVVEQKIDASIIGGFVLKVGDRVFDGSVSTSLRKLRNEFDDNAYVKMY